MKRSFAHEFEKRICPLSLYLFLIIGFEVAVTRLMKRNQNRHDFAQVQASLSLAKLESTSQKLLLPLRFKAFAEIIDGAEQFF